MTATNKRILLWGVIGAAILSGLIFAFTPRAITVDMVKVTTQAMTVTVDDEGETRVHDTFVLSAPVAGRLRRIEMHAGDPVTANTTVIAEIEPGDPTFLDPRSETQAKAAVQAAESAKTLAAAEVDRAQADLEFAEVEHARARRLFAERTITRREADAAERAYKTAVATLATAQAALQVRKFELEQAQALLMSPTETQLRGFGCPCLSLTAPIDGTVLRVLNKSERVVQAGDPLVEIGDPRDLEIVTDYLSVDAVQIQPGQKVLVHNWGADQPLEGVVQRIEPFGFTKVSALGISEQRVNVVVDFVSPHEEWARLGHGYQVETRVVLWEQGDVLTVPLTALFRLGETWTVFLHRDGRAVLQQVEVGRRNGLVAEIVSGVDAGDEVIVHPSDRVVDGVRVRSRA